MNVSMLVPPLVGSVIGYSTNWLAIKMLFKPHKAKYIGKFQLPFTPGVIPRERDRIASSLGEAVGNKLLTEDVILAELTGDNVIIQLKEYVAKDLLSKPININALIEDAYNDKDDVTKVYENIAAGILTGLVGQLEEDIFVDHIIGQIIAERFAYEKNLKEGFGDEVDQVIVELISSNDVLIANEVEKLLLNEETKEKLTGIISTILLEKIGGMAAMFIQPESIYTMISDYILQYLSEEENREEVSGVLSRGVIGFMNKPISSLVDSNQYKKGIQSIVSAFKSGIREGLKSDIVLEKMVGFIRREFSNDIIVPEHIRDGLSEQVENWYRSFAKNHLPAFMEQFNVSDIVEKEINQFSVSEVESLIFNIVDKELRAITWFGAILGFAMGMVTLIF